MIMPNYSYILA